MPPPTARKPSRKKEFTRARRGNREHETDRKETVSCINPKHLKYTTLLQGHGALPKNPKLYPKSPKFGGDESIRVVDAVAELLKGYQTHTKHPPPRPLGAAAASIDFARDSQPNAFNRRVALKADVKS